MHFPVRHQSLFVREDWKEIWTKYLSNIYCNDLSHITALDQRKKVILNGNDLITVVSNKFSKRNKIILKKEILWFHFKPPALRSETQILILLGECFAWGNFRTGLREQFAE